MSTKHIEASMISNWVVSVLRILLKGRGFLANLSRCTNGSGFKLQVRNQRSSKNKRTATYKNSQRRFST